MKRLLNTLYVSTQGTHLSKEDEAIRISVDHELKHRVPVKTLAGVVCFGNVSMTPALMGYCAENRVAVSYMTEYGRFLARVQGPVSGNVLLRREQYRRADEESSCADLSRALVAAKVANCRINLRRAARERPDDPRATDISAAADTLTLILDELKTPAPLGSSNRIQSGPLVVKAGCPGSMS